MGVSTMRDIKGSIVSGGNHSSVPYVPGKEDWFISNGDEKERDASPADRASFADFLDIMRS